MQRMYFTHCLLTFIFLHLLVSSSTRRTVDVAIPNVATFRGFQGDNGINQFLGIPYALPPIGNLRFADPEQAQKQQGILDCTRYGSQCLQQGPPGWVNPGNQSEDCLFLNIFTPQLIGAVPVMFFIHGGGFTTGTGEIYDGNEYAAMFGVVLVNINYRLGVFGFYRDEANGITGNQGLKDQIMALTWVNQNIASFGGDPQRITIFGESAGSASVSYLVLSPQATGLFQRAIMQSGAATSPWAFVEPKATQSMADKLKKHLGCLDQTCLQKPDPLNILETANNLFPFLVDEHFAPTQDGSVVTANPATLVDESRYNDVELMIGFNGNEGWLFVPMVWPQFNTLSDNGANPDFCVSDSIHRRGIVDIASTMFSNPQSPCMMYAFVHEYSQWAPPSTPSKRAQSIADFVSDHWFKIPLINFVRKAPRHASVFLYNYTSNYTAELYGGMPLWMGAVHASELGLVFGAPFRNTPGLPVQPTNEDKSVSRDIMMIYSTFAKDGTSFWPKFKSSTQEQYLVIDSKPTKTVLRYPRWNRNRFWTEYAPRLSRVVCHEREGSTTSRTYSTTSGCRSTTLDYVAMLYVAMLVRIN